jgi:hypothetical protein
MIKRTLVVLAALILSFGAMAADPPEVEVATSAVGGSTVVVAVHNPDGDPEVVRIQVTVVVEGVGQQTLTSPNLVIGGAATVSVSLSATGTIVAIGDSPEPIPPSL